MYHLAEKYFPQELYTRLHSARAGCQATVFLTVHRLQNWQKLNCGQWVSNKVIITLKHLKVK